MSCLNAGKRNSFLVDLSERASNRSRKRCVPWQLSAVAGSSRRNRSWSPYEAWLRVRNSTLRRVRYKLRPCGMSRAASLPCARTLAVITRSTSCQVHSRASIATSDGIILHLPVSAEMVQKSAAIGASVWCRFQRPPRWQFAWRRARVSRLLLSRTDGFELFTHPRRISYGTVMP